MVWSYECAYLRFDPGSPRFPQPSGCGSLRPCCSPKASGWTEPLPWYFRDYATLATQLASARNLVPTGNDFLFPLRVNTQEPVVFSPGRTVDSIGCDGDEQTLRGTIRRRGGKKQVVQGVNVPELQELPRHRRNPQANLKMYHSDQCWRTEVEFEWFELINPFKNCFARPGTRLKLWRF